MIINEFALFSKFAGRSVILSALLLCSVPFAEEVRILTPDLNGPGLPKEIVLSKPWGKAPWKADGGVLRSPDYSAGGMSGFEIGSRDWSDYEVGFKLRRLGTHPVDQHFGMSLRSGVTIYTRGGGWIINMRERKVHLAFGKPFPELQAGAEVPWTDFSISIKGSVLSVKVNGETVASRDDLPEGSGCFSFYTYRNTLELKDIFIRIYKSGVAQARSASPNIALNASFEECTLGKLPDYWGVRHWGIDDAGMILNHEAWLKTFGTDDTTAWHGKRSMRLENKTDVPVGDSRRMWSCNFGTKVGSTYTLSAYMKADRPGVKIGLSASPYSEDRKLEKIFTLTQDWVRYEYTYTRTRNALYTDMLYFTLQNKGVVWLDAVQLEPGEQATPFQLANADVRLTVHEGNVEKALYEVPVYQTPLHKETPGMDGLLNDPVWSKIPLLELKSVYGKEIREKATARIFHTTNGIYIGLDAQEADSGQIRCSKQKRDEYVWLDPSFEIFIDSKLTRGTYHHLVFNADGVQYDANLGNSAWSGHWQVNTARKKDHSGWTAEVFIPFGAMGIDFNNGDRWGFNICRNNPRFPEISSWAPTYGHFHEPLRFGQLVISEAVQKNYLAGIRNFLLKYAGGEQSELSAEAFNHTGHDLKAELVCIVRPSQGGNSLCFEKKICIPDGKTLPVILGMVPGKLADNFQVSVTLKEDSRLIVTSIETVSGGNILCAIPQFDYCTTETQMPVQVRSKLNPEYLQALTLETVVTRGQEELYRNSAKLAGGMLELQLPVGEWTPGDCELICRLIGDSGEIAKSESVFQKLAPSSHEVKLDRFRRITLINGKPFFPLGIFWEGSTTPEVIEFLAKGNVNTVHLIASPTEELLETGRKHGVMFQFQLDVHARKGKSQETISNWKHHPAILSWYTYDEAFTTEWGRKNLKEIVKTIADSQELDPYHPVVMLENIYGMNYLIEKGMDFPGKIPILDYYAYPPSSNVQSWDNYSKAILGFGEADGRPAWAVPFMSGYGFHASRDMSPAELEYQVYICAINGIRGILFWASYPKAPGTFAKLSSLFGEIRQLVEPLISLEQVPAIQCNSEKVRFTVKKHNGFLYLITVNESKEALQARFDLSELTGVKTAEVLFENRSVPVVQNCLEDRYDGLGRRVYRMILPYN